MPVEIKATAPSPSANPRQSAAVKPALARKTKERAQNLQELGTLASTGLIMARQYADAGAVARYFPAISTEVARLAEDNEKIGEALDTLGQVGPYAALIAAVMPLVLQIAVNHDKAPVVPQLGVVSKSVLETQVKMEIRQMEISLQQQMAEMEREAAEFEKLAAEDARNNPA